MVLGKLLPLYPCFNDRRSKAPEFAHLNRMNLAAVDESLQGSRMHLENGCGLMAVEQRFFNRRR